jgi:hypothetical protein
MKPLALVIALVCMPVVFAQDITLPTGSAPKTTTLGPPVQETPALSDLEACHIDVSLQNETIVALKIQLADLQKKYDLVMLQADRARRTPSEKDGHVWDWTRDEQTGQPKGYVKKK